jgi:hypothetical protein
VSSPGYISPGSPNNNYHIQQNAALKDRLSSSQTTVDVGGQARPYSSSYDIGADEYTPFALIVGARDCSLYLYWPEASTYLTGGLHHYEIVVTCEGSCSGNPINVGLSTSYLLTNLTNFKPYTVTIYAKDSGGATIASSMTVTAAPTDLFNYIPFVVR